MNWNYLMTIAALLFCSVSLFAQAQGAIKGKWQDANHPEKQVEIYAKSTKYYGATLEERSKLIFRDLKWNHESKAYKGFLIHPETGRELAIEIEMIGEDLFQFSAGSFLFKKNFRFKRI